jgi:hypothetical protein
MLLPLAGHEFGHAVWQQQQLERRYSAEIKQRIVSRVKQNPSLYQETFEGEVGDLLFESNISSAHLWGLRQAEETFCDCFGVRLFAESYLHSFAYVLAPGFAETGRVFDYPPMRQRVANIQLAASHFQVEVPTGFGDWFIDDYVVSGGRTTYLAELADRACAELVEDLIKKVAEVTQSAPHRSKERMAGAERMFLIPAPASRIGDLSSLLNAAWRAYENYVRSGTSLDSRKLSILFEVVLKSIEVLEIEARISHS